jgi:regulator of replication initiation timing
MEKTA